MWQHGHRAGSQGMARILKALGLGLVIAAIVWLVTLWQWQNAERDIGMADIIWQLLVLPVVLTLGLLVALWGVQRLRAPAASASSSADAPASATDLALSAEARAQRDACAWVLAEAVHLPVGTDADTAWLTLQAGGVRPDLDPQLQDLDGLPVFTARVPELALEDWLQVHSELMPPDEGGLPPAVLRALALLEAPLHRVLDALPPLLADVSESDGGVGVAASGVGEAPGKAHLAGVAQPMAPALQAAREAKRPRVMVRLVWPSHWQASDRDAATAWLQSQCGALLDWSTAMQATPPVWLSTPLEQSESLWEEVDQQLLRWAREPRPELLLILAVDSLVDAERIDQMQARGELFTAQHQTGRVPGEGAAALLLAHPAWPQLPSQVPEALRLWRPLSGRREKSADAAGRTGCAALVALLTEVLHRSTPPHEGLTLVSDADHRASRTGELYEALQSLAPELDPMQQVCRAGEACGDLGAARALVPTALACAALRHSDHAQPLAVVAHVQSSHERVVVALSPAPPRAAEPAAA